MGELHVNMNITIDGVIQANGGPSEEDAGFAYAGWERPYGDAEYGAQVTADVQASDALLLGRTTYDIFRRYWPGKTDGIGLAFDRVPKYVASRGATELSWANSTQVTDPAAEVRDLRPTTARRWPATSPPCSEPRVAARIPSSSATRWAAWSPPPSPPGTRAVGW